MKLFYTLAILIALIFSTQAKVQYGIVTTDYWSSAFPSGASYTYHVAFTEAFQSSPNVVLSIGRLDFTKSAFADIFWRVSYSNISSTGFDIVIDLQGDGTFFQMAVNYVAYTQSVQQFITGTVKGDMISGDTVNMNFNLQCKSSNIQAAAFVTGMKNPAGYFEWGLELGTPSISSSKNGQISGTVPLTFQFPTYDGYMNSVLVDYIIGCEENLQIQEYSEETTTGYKQYTLIVNDYSPDANQYGILTSARIIRFNPSKNIRLQTGEKLSISDGIFFYNNGVFSDSISYGTSYTDVVFIQNECNEQCTSCSNQVCSACIDGYSLIKGDCLSKSSFIYWYVNGFDYEKVVGQAVEGYTPGEGYFVWASTSCETTYNQNGVDIVYKTNQSEGFWQWIEGGVNTVKDEAAPLGYWVRDYNADERWWQPAQFDPENPEVNWNTWSWLLEWILTYSQYSYTDEITLDELTEMCQEQKYVYTQAEIQYVFNVIGNYDEGISYGDILTTIVKIQYSGYAQRVLGTCK